MYLHNSSPHKILEGKTPEEAFIGVRPEIGHLSFFGCPGYIHVPVKKRTKLEPFGKKSIFVGYSENSKAFRVFMPGQWKKMVSRDVNLVENLASRKSHDLPTIVEDIEQLTSKGEQSS